jgi:esterase/lipase superfamily enzyme
MKWTIFPFLALIFLVSGCARLPEAVFGIDNAEMPAAQVFGASRHDIFIASTRRPDAELAELFSSNRSTGLAFARASVSIPPEHVPGNIERPKKLPPDPRKDFVILDPAYLTDGGEFVSAINSALDSRPKGEREVLVFVHGYNTTPAAAVSRIAQFVEDSGFDGVPVLFTWASRGKTVDYVYDMNSALQGRSGLLALAEILSKTRADRFSILAHSMGNLLTVEALKQAKLEGRFDRRGKIDAIILASPDIDLDVFRDQMEVLGDQRRKFVVLISSNDVALRVSRKLAGGVDRVGDADPEVLAGTGVKVIDLSKIDDEGSLHHAKFADSPEVVQLIGLRLNSGDTLHTSNLGPNLPESPLSIFRPENNLLILAN